MFDVFKCGFDFVLVGCFLELDYTTCGCHLCQRLLLVVGFGVVISFTK